MIRDGVFLLRAFATISLWIALISLARAVAAAIDATGARLIARARALIHREDDHG